MNHINDWLICKTTINFQPVVYKFLKQRPSTCFCQKFPIKAIISWSYDGQNNIGLPDKNTTDQMLALDARLHKLPSVYQHHHCIYTFIGNNNKESVFQVSNKTLFIEELTEALAGNEFPIKIKFCIDKNWQELAQLQQKYLT